MSPISTLTRNDLPPLVAVIGPTGSGKTALGVALAQRFHGAIVSCDAKQCFRGMDIGTAKEKDLPVPQYLIDVLEPGGKVTVAWFQRESTQVIDRLHAEGTLPILVGGSMLYAEAITDGYTYPGAQPRYATLKLGISVDRAVLRLRISERTQRWLSQGILDEIRRLLDRGVPPTWLKACGLEYRHFTAHLLGELSLDEAIQKTNTSQFDYVKRQYTWWRRHPDIAWVSGASGAVDLVDRWLHLERAAIL